MLFNICKILNISHYCLDITRKCCLKYIATHNSYKALIYFAVDGHMYHVTDSKITKSLVESAKDIEHKFSSSCMKEEDYDVKNIYDSKIPILII